MAYWNNDLSKPIYHIKVNHNNGTNTQVGSDQTTVHVAEIYGNFINYQPTATIQASMLFQPTTTVVASPEYSYYLGETPVMANLQPPTWNNYPVGCPTQSVFYDAFGDRYLWNSKETEIQERHIYFPYGIPGNVVFADHVNITWPAKSSDLHVNRALIVYDWGYIFGHYDSPFNYVRRLQTSDFYENLYDYAPDYSHFYDGCTYPMLRSTSLLKISDYDSVKSWYRLNTTNIEEEDLDNIFPFDVVKDIDDEEYDLSYMYANCTFPNSWLYLWNMNNLQFHNCENMFYRSDCGGSVLDCYTYNNSEDEYECYQELEDFLTQPGYLASGCTWETHYDADPDESYYYSPEINLYIVPCLPSLTHVVQLVFNAQYPSRDFIDGFKEVRNYRIVKR